MLEIQHITTGANFHVGTPQALPQAWRLMTLRSLPVRTGVRVQAKLFNQALQRTVTWYCREVRPELKAGILVGIRSTSNITQTEEDGAVEIVRLVKLQRVEPEVNLFQTVPPQWVSDVSLLERARVLWQDLSPPMKAWFNALFWNEPARFKGFLQAPASIAHHHARVHGLLMHSLDCAERARLLAQWDGTVNRDVLTMATLLHDVGKAQEYEWDHYKNSWKLSGRGALLGHKLSGLEWLAAARAFVPNGVHDSLAMSLYHALTACHAPEWVGLRSPRTPEAHYLASVDTLSGLCELTHRLADTDGGFGKYHKVFRGGPFTTAKPIDLAAQNQW